MTKLLVTANINTQGDQEMRKIRGFLWPVILMLVLVIAGCGGVRAGENGVDVSIEAAQNMWSNKEAIIIDVRTPGEYREGHIPGVANIPLDQLADRAKEVPKDKKVLLICRSGNRSGQGTSLLRGKGFDNVYNITGGMSTWRGPLTN